MIPLRRFRRSRLAAGTILLCGAAAFGAPAVAQDAGGRCLTCHLDLDDERLSEPARVWSEDVHYGAGLACSGCHGGDAATAIEGIAHAGMLASPPRGRIPEICSRCHSNAEFMRDYDPDIRIDQADAYRTSRHGELLSRGDPNVATCVDCHSTHGIRSPSNTESPIHPENLPETCGSCHADEDRMRPYGIPTDQLEEYRRSVHWETLTERGDLTAPVCNDCHGNHGAVPPGHNSVGRVCAECHFQIGEYFALSPHDSVFVGDDRPGCATCHGNHDIRAAGDELLGLGDGSTCTAAGCHTDSDPGGITAAEMRTLVDSLLRMHARSDSLLDEAELAGMPVDGPRFELAQVQNAIVGARSVMHTASIDSMRAKIDEGLTAAEAGLTAGEGAFAELRDRRFGLAVSSLVILVLVMGLLIRIRDLGV